MKHLYVFLFLILCSCANSKGDKNTGTVALEPNELASVSAEVCPTGKSLTYVESDETPIDDLKPAIAVVSGSGRCASVDTVDDKWYDITGREWFYKVSFPSCVLNNSIWTIESSSSMDGNATLRYVNTQGNQFIHVNGTKEIDSTYARDHAGIRRLICQ